MNSCSETLWHRTQHRRVPCIDHSPGLDAAFECTCATARAVDIDVGISTNASAGVDKTSSISFNGSCSCRTACPFPCPNSAIHSDSTMNRLSACVGDQALLPCPSTSTSCPCAHNCDRTCTCTRLHSVFMQDQHQIPVKRSTGTGTHAEPIRTRTRIRRRFAPSSARSSSVFSILIHAFVVALALVPIFVVTVAAKTSSGGGGGSEAPVGLSGSIERCEREGEVFPLAGLLQDPCYKCLCRNGEVQCEKQTCPSLEGCFLIVSGLKEGCCEVCKGCTVGNQTYPHGKEVLLDDCSVQTCLAGIVTKSPLQCHVPCSHPAPPTHRPGTGTSTGLQLHGPASLSSCCPTCNSCMVNGKLYKHGEEAILNGDPCTRCTCNRGSLSCIKKACPVLACPPSATYLAKGDCCPRCNGTRTRYIPRTVCILGDKVYPSKTAFRLDTCTNCTCMGTTAICDRISCPALLDCEPRDQILSPGSCCPTCAPNPLLSDKNTESEENSLVKTQCEWRDHVFKNGEKWDVNSCQSCICDWGKVRCTEQVCPADISCPWGYQLQNKPGQCCPECVGEEGVCTVFGDPHYRSFDGRVFNFQGACKYLLTSDCKGKTFSVRVRNDARASSTFSWTRTVTLKTKEGRLTLGQKMRIKFNGKRIGSLPFQHGSLKVTADGYSALVQTGAGVQLLWDGDSFLEVTVPHRLHGRLCGLCGNFNGNRTDDFVTRRGGPVNHPSAFGQSWRVGGKKACSRPEEVKGPEPLCRKNWLVREKAEKLCNALKSHIFAPCAKVVSPDRFFKACKVDMCECPHDRKCHCDALMAYSRSCKLAGAEVNANWREMTRCSHKKASFWKA